MVAERKVVVEVKVVKEGEVSEEAVEAFVEALEGREKFYTVEELEKLLRRKGQRGL